MLTVQLLAVFGADFVEAKSEDQGDPRVLLPTLGILSAPTVAASQSSAVRNPNCDGWR